MYHMGCGFSNFLKSLYKENRIKSAENKNNKSVEVKEKDLPSLRKENIYEISSPYINKKTYKKHLYIKK